MKICWFGFLAKNFSWSIVAQNISRELIKMGHEVDLFSTNGVQYFPSDLLPHLKGYLEENTPINSQNYNSLIGSKLEKVYDMQLSYTVLKNFNSYFIRGAKNRFGIWNYETTILPKSFAKNYKYVDKVLPSSNFSKKIFIDNGIPADAQVVVPHGIHLERFQNLGKYPLKTSKRYKILANIAQPHLRKNIPSLLKAYGRAFSKSNDVCLVLKISKASPQKISQQVSFNDIFNNFRNEFKNHGEVEVIDKFIPDIEFLYNACDIVLTMSHSECFWIPGLEAMAANKIVVAPCYGGQLDYMNDDNSILIDGKEIRADIRMQYWEPSPYARVFEPDVSQCAEKLKDIVAHYDDYLKKFSPKMQEMLPRFTWTSVANQIMSLAK